MPTYPVRKNLPVAYSTEVGRIVTRWARFEWELKRVAYTILEIGEKAGRLSVREPRASEYLTMIEDLIQVRNLSLSDKLTRQMKSAKAAAERLGNLRNALAHGIWIKHDQTKLPTLQLVSGGLTSSVMPQPVPKAKILPHALAFELSGLRAARTDIEGLTRYVRAIRTEIEAQLPA